MSSFFKKWHTSPGKVKHKDDSKADKNGDQSKADDVELPPSIRRPDRNLSISRSGRHKMRQRQRATIMDDGLYKPDGATGIQDAGQAAGSGGAQAQAGLTPANAGGNYHCRETVDNTAGNLNGSQRMSRAPTAV